MIGFAEASVFCFVGLLGALFVGYFARWVATHFVSEDIAPVAGFSFALGSGGWASQRGIDAATSLQEGGLTLGSLMGLVLVWYFFFKREAANG